MWQATDGDGDHNAIVRLLLLTGCRASEIAGLRWSEVYSDRIVIAAERVKNSRAHMVPITPAVRAILDRQPRGPERDSCSAARRPAVHGLGRQQADA